MNYAIIGSGAIGGALATQFARSGIAAVIANRRGPDSFHEDFTTRVTPVDIGRALEADIVILAVPFDAVADVAALRADWTGKIVVDATNAIEFPAFRPRDLGGRPSTAIVQTSFPGARVVKAFNTLPAPVLAEDPRRDGGNRVIFVSGDHAEANDAVASMAASLGFSPIVLGTIAEGGLLQQFGGALMVQDLLKQR
ncbi:NADPH-dependent F420 reductase [Luteibacter yeojuensis]